VIDPARGFDQVVMWPGRVWWPGRARWFVADREIDASGQWVLPGLVDLAVRLREPGTSTKACWQSEMGCRVAAA
jgi:dihydroorotase